MQAWHGTYLGLREVPRALSEFELQAFFTFSSMERGFIQRRRGPALKLGLALHMGFLRMSGRPLDAFRVLPVVLLRHLGKELGIPVPDVASLRALYRRRSTLFEHQQLACRALGFGGMTEHQRRALHCILKDEVLRSGEREQLLARARLWLYEHQVLLVHDRTLRGLVAAALAELEADTAAALRKAVAPALLQRWLEATSGTRADGQAVQSWLWAPPAKHSTRQIAEVFERIELLLDLGVDRVLGDLNAALVRRLARRLALRAPSASAKIKEPARAVEVACFLRHCLMTATDQWILMVQRRVVDLWRQSAAGVPTPVDWGAQYRALLEELARLSADEAVPDAELRTRLAVHRKGATRSFPPHHPELPADYQTIGQPVIIRGSGPVALALRRRRAQLARRHERRGPRPGLVRRALRLRSGPGLSCPGGRNLVCLAPSGSQRLGLDRALAQLPRSRPLVPALRALASGGPAPLRAAVVADPGSRISRTTARARSRGRGRGSSRGQRWHSARGR